MVKCTMDNAIKDYHNELSDSDSRIALLLYEQISRQLPEAENKLWHRHPVWFLEGNPIVGYSKRKNGINLMFWSGQSFDEPGLRKEGSFKAGEVLYTDVEQINLQDLQRWLEKARNIQWDYKNLIKRKGKLERLK